MPTNQWQNRLNSRNSYKKGHISTPDITQCSDMKPPHEDGISRIRGKYSAPVQQGVIFPTFNITTTPNERTGCCSANSDRAGTRRTAHYASHRCLLRPTGLDDVDRTVSPSACALHRAMHKALTFELSPRTEPMKRGQAAHCSHK